MVRIASPESGIFVLLHFVQRGWVELLFDQSKWNAVRVFPE
jgi:hypothetical protein